jgi:hypothetical protein
LHLDPGAKFSFGQDLVAANLKLGFRRAALSNKGEAAIGMQRSEER